MNRNSIRWRLPASYAFIALVAALSLGSVMILVLQNYYAQQERNYLTNNAFALQPILEEVLQSDLPGTVLQDQIKALAFLSQAQIRLFDAHGKIIADSGVPAPDQVIAVSGAPDGMVMFSLPVDSPTTGQPPTIIYNNDQSVIPQVIPFEKEVPIVQDGDIVLPISASLYGYGFTTRTDSDFTHRSSQVVKVSLNASDNSALGELEFSNGPSYGANIIRSVKLALLIASAFAILVAALMGWFISRQITRPVLVLEQATREMAQGNLSVRVNLSNEEQLEFLSLANSFNGMAEQVERIVSILRTFIADAAHELHTPLTALRVNLELARDEDALVSGTSANEKALARTRFLLRAQEQSQRLEELVKSLLDLSRLETAESKSNLTAIDLIQLAREVGEQFASRAEQSGQNFITNIPNEVVQVQGNEMQLKQVMINLLENAFKFTPINGEISLTAERAEDELILCVSDTGIGIPKEDIPYLFKRFHRASNAAEYPGSGLGLAITKAITDMHKGQLAVQSDLGKGTTVQMRFPVL